MLSNLLALLRARLLMRARQNHYPSYYSSHSQFGEDMITRFLTNDRPFGFYVDIGAHHPIAISNTYHFYLKGWRGIVVDAASGTEELFRLLRPRDLALSLCIGTEDGLDVEYFEFDQSALNTIDPVVAARTVSEGRGVLKGSRKLSTTRLATCLARHAPRDTSIDFMSVDLEGLDEDILLSHDWAAWCPNIVILEKHGVPLHMVGQLKIAQQLGSVGIIPVAKCGPSIILANPDVLRKTYGTPLVM